ncbi:MAG: hypothetical protein Q7S01_06165 [bacterium]|nr:hypothetical protein [bacterium]
MVVKISQNRVLFEGVRLDLARTTVASHATTADIWIVAGNQIDWTGTATTTAFPNAPQGGVERVLICAGACSFTAGANMLIDGVASAATVTCAANDQVIVRSVSTTQFKLSRIRYDGTAGLGANTFTADQTLAENAGIVLDAALSADGKYSGIVEAGTSAAALAFGELCYRVTATGKWDLASGAAAGVGAVISTGELGICVLAAGGADAATTLLLFGKVRADALFDTFTVGAPVYMSAATAGKIVSAAPTGTTDFTVRKVGFAEDANTVFFRPSTDYITLA